MANLYRDLEKHKLVDSAVSAMFAADSFVLTAVYTQQQRNKCRVASICRCDCAYVDVPHFTNHNNCFRKPLLAALQFLQTFLTILSGVVTYCLFAAFVMVFEASVQQALLAMIYLLFPVLIWISQPCYLASEEVVLLASAVYLYFRVR